MTHAPPFKDPDYLEDFIKKCVRTASFGPDTEVARPDKRMTGKSILYNTVMWKKKGGGGLKTRRKAKKGKCQTTKGTWE